MRTDRTAPPIMNPEYETMPRDEIRRRQWEGVKTSLVRAYEESQFYREFFDKASVNPRELDTLDDFRERVPFMSKADLIRGQDINPPYGNRLLVPESEVRYIFVTSGTSGLGQEIHALTQEDWMPGTNTFMWHMAAAGLVPGDITALCWPIGLMPGGQGCYGACREMGLVVLPMFLLDTKAKLIYMKRLNPHHIWATPAYLTRLSMIAEEMGIDPRRDYPHLKAISLSTEPFPAVWAERMEEFWGAPIHDVYGSTQMGLVFYTCHHGVVRDGKHACYHMADLLMLTEVLDPQTGKPVEYGEVGEAVFTTFSKKANPLIRFRSNDRVRLLPPDACDCGRTSDLLEAGTVSRLDDMIKMKATNVWPQAVDEVVFAHEEIDEYNGRVFIDAEGRERVKVTLEFRARVSDAQAKQSVLASLPKELKDRIGVSVEIQEVPVGTVERFEYKARRWVDEREQGLQRVRFVEKK